MAGQLRAIVYSRVSTDAQERDGTSLVTQERASQGYVDADGWTLLESIRDTASGYSLDRPGMKGFDNFCVKGRWMWLSLTP